MAELYPDVRLTLLYQRDTLDLLSKYGLAGEDGRRAGVANSRLTGPAGSLSTWAKPHSPATTPPREQPGPRSETPSTHRPPRQPPPAGGQARGVRRLGDAARLPEGTIAEHRACRETR